MKYLVGICCKPCYEKYNAFQNYYKYNDIVSTVVLALPSVYIVISIFILVLRTTISIIEISLEE